VRAFFTQNGQWGIVGYIEDGNRQRKNVVVVISDDQGPRCLTLQETEQQAGLPCLSYGKKFDLLPEYGEPCELSGPSSPGLSAPGNLELILPTPSALR
jgi:hypothetical protein